MTRTLVRTGILLAGGASSRMRGPNKALMRLGQQRVLERILGTLDQCFDTVLIVAKDPAPYRGFGHRVVTDRVPVSSPLAGIHAGLFHAEGPYAFCTACDTPFLRSGLVTELVGSVTPEVDVVVPRLGTYFQPLCAIYSKRCIGPIEAMLHKGILKADLLYKEMSVREIDFHDLEKADPGLDSFININTPEDFRRAEALLSEKSDRNRTSR